MIVIACTVFTTNPKIAATMIPETMTTIQFLGILLAVSLFIDLIGFYKTVWFISIGYAASIVAFVIVTVGFLIGTDILPLLALQLLAAFIWGTRLGLFLAARERKASYQASIKDQTDKSESLPIFVKACIWSSTSLLYVCMYSPVVFLTESIDSLDDTQMKIAATGVGFMWLGLALEAFADHQKSAAKAKNPGFVSSGLYSWVRYPNYLGEITFWVGNFVAGTVGYSVWWHWVTAITGIVCIILIMMGSTKRLEVKQDDRYGEDPNYKEYVKTVPVLFPWLPIYSLKNVKVYLE